MKTTTLLLGIITFSGFLIGNSNAIIEKEDPSLPQVSLQLVVRNSSGELVAYEEPTRMYIMDLGGVHKYLDGIDSKTVIQIGEKNFQMIEFKKIEHYTENHQGQMATYCMVYYGKCVMLFRHNSFIAQPGDTLTLSWKIIRTVH